MSEEIKNPVNSTLRAWADQEQAEIVRQGIRPVFWPGFSHQFRGVMDNQLRTIVPAEEYFYVGEYSNGLAKALSKKTKKWGFIDRHGNEVIPCTWKSVGDFTEYLAGVQDDKTKLCGFCDVRGTMVIPCQWKGVRPFHEGMAIFMDLNNLLGYINLQGEVVIPPIWKKAMNFVNGLALVSNRKRYLILDLPVYINKKGEIVKEYEGGPVLIP